jgi:HEAT repeat protein
MTAERDDRRRAVTVAGHRVDAAAIRAAAHDPDGAVRASALGAADRADLLESSDLQAALADSDPRVRRRAVEIAARYANADISALLSDPEDTVVEMAAWSCGERVPAPPEIVTQLAWLATSHRDALVREAAVAALGAAGDPDGLSAILQAMNDKPAIRRRAVIALTPFDGPDVDAALRAALGDRDWQVRQLAEDLGPDS